MEIIQISEGKLKVMLTKADLEEFDLDAQTLDYADSETKELFSALLAHIKETVGFQTDGYRVLVRLFPSRDGGCELFLTRIRDFYSEEDETETEQTHPQAFGFERIEDLLTVCRRLRAIGYPHASSAYISDAHRFYLFLENPARSLDEKSAGISPYAFLSEYGKAESAEGLRGFLFEHGRLLCEQDAVERLGVL